MLKKIVLDLETQKLFEEVGGRGKNHLLKISVVGIYDYSTDRYQIFREHEIPKLSSILQTADQIIGYNIKDFDFEVLRPYLNFNVDDLPYCDLLEKYCLDDVKITKQIYDYVIKNKKLLYRDFFKAKEIALKLEEAVPRVGVQHQAALF